MIRIMRVVVLATLLLMPAWSFAASSGAAGLFQETQHAFGTVPRGPVVSHSFRLTNTTQETLRIVSIRVSCGCITATALQGVIAPGESTSIQVQMDTRKYIGFKSFTIFVQFGEPRWEEVRLTVSGDSRDDVAIQPESLQFGTVGKGSTATRSAQVTLANGMQVVSVAAESHYIRLNAREIRRNGSEVTYEVSATLREDTPVGKWFTDLWLNTNNANSPRIRLPLAVDIEPALNVSPAIAQIAAAPGREVERRVILRGTQPFKIKEVQGTDEVVQLQFNREDVKPVHILTIKVKPGEKPQLSRTLKIVTDLPSDPEVNLPVTVTAE